jgi:hypothetical protein
MRRRKAGPEAAVSGQLGVGSLCCTGLVTWELNLKGPRCGYLLNPAWVTCSAQKTAESLFDWILAHLARQKGGPSLGVGL